MNNDSSIVHLIHFAECDFDQILFHVLKQRMGHDSNLGLVALFTCNQGFHLFNVLLSFSHLNCSSY